MDSFRTNLASIIDMNLAAQKEAMAFNESQLKLASAQFSGGLDAYRNTLAATHNAFAAMTKVYVEALRPAAA